MKLSNNRRIQAIADLLQRDTYVKAKDLAIQFEVSMETIRKDLMYLEEKGVAKKEYGGASLSLIGIEKEMEFRKDHEEHKRAIARYVCEMLKEYHSVILDTSSTTQACVSYLNLLPAMDIVTNSLDICKQLNGYQHNVFLIPGRKRERNGSLLGNWAEQYLSHLRVDVCLLGTSGLLGSDGPTSHSYEELSTKQAMIRQSDLVFVLADASKFQSKGMHTITDWENIDGVITDATIPRKTYLELNKKVNVYIAGEE